MDPSWKREPLRTYKQKTTTWYISVCNRYLKALRQYRLYCNTTNYKLFDSSGKILTLLMKEIDKISMGRKNMLHVY